MARDVRRIAREAVILGSDASGWRELLRLRDAYQQRDPSGYTARKFHDEVMSYGGLPITLARWGMDLAE